MSQIYLLDLKNGLELKDFTICPNVKMVKTIADAVTLLRQIKAEMLKRFEYLEKNNLNQIVPERDKFDRIIVCIDEASVLYGTRRANSSEKELAEEATEITDLIAKQSRAAAIHLIFATQKVTKETINTHIQENLEGRMCFEVNSLQGSNVVLGCADAYDLPHIPGRGIWKVGTKKVEVQTPYIDDEEIKKRCQAVADEYKNGKRSLHQRMFSPKEAKNSSAKAVDTYVEGKGKPKDE